MFYSVRHQNMFHSVTFLFLLAHLPHTITPLRACVPNTSFVLNGRICYCDYQGRWTEASCKTTLRTLCQPGEVISQGCNECVCNDNGQLHCTNTYCYSNTSKTMLTNRSLLEYGQKCMPFQSYYVNCSVCICPSSGQSFDATCSVDKSCYLDSKAMNIQKIVEVKYCIPNLMYLFPCIQCQCSEKGVFVTTKCIEKCQPQITSEFKCTPNTLYRNACNICRCPKSGVPNVSLCIEANCHRNSIRSLRSTSYQCIPRTFTKPRCLYCECLPGGMVSEYSCLVLDCTKTLNHNQDSLKKQCSPGELVPVCIECFCFNDGRTNVTYCTRNCSYQSKLDILEKVLNESLIDPNLIDKNKIKEIEQGDDCIPNDVYFNEGRYCICPKNNDKESTKFICTPLVEHSKKIPYATITENKYKIGNTSCEPNTLVDFDCNTCYCSKNGKIDPKWCTYDDCEAKRIIQESHKSNTIQNSIDDPNGLCIPGSISRVQCNFCICPESGKLKDRACTKNNCFDNVEVIDDKFTCEPLAYYEVDCNICYCPHDGLKNVAKCTKNHCEKSFLRSSDCEPGQLFSDECKVCVCPPNGNKTDKVCTNNTCGARPLNTFKLTQSVLENQVYNDATRKLDLCFPGEEFVNGCDLCVCSELGLKTYATCESILCDEKSEENSHWDVQFQNFERVDVQKNRNTKKSIDRIRRDIHDDCFVYNISQSAERKECTPGSMYIIRCRQCICPYVGNINNFCRPLPKSYHCEQAFPGFNYLTMGRRNTKNDSIIKAKVTNEEEVKNVTVTIKHLNHKVHKCNKHGKVMDECFICDCENDGVIIEEHCYKSDAITCDNKKPTFLSES